MTADPVVVSVLELLDELVRIGAPTGQEHRRAAFVARWLQDAGLGQPEMDEHANVSLWLGPADAPALMLDAHLDTVFPDETVTLHKQADRWHAPGISDNTIHVAMLMAWARLRHETGKPWPSTLLSFSVGEEGRGDLLGMKCMTRRYDRRIAQAVVLDMRIHDVCCQGVGSIRWQVRFEARSGHSWSQFGHEGALRPACRWVTRMASLAPWRPGELTWNVGQFTSQDGVTRIASQTDFMLEVRGTDTGRLAEVGSRVEASLRDEANLDEGLQVTCERVGDRPGGRTPRDHPLVTTAEAVHRELGLDVCHRVAGTNANWLMHQNIPAVCLGLALGEHAHTRQESLDLTVIPLGMAKLDRLFDRLM